MTHANVGSLLVFDPSKLHLVCTSKDRCTNTSKDAVVGIITERGEPCPREAQHARCKGTQLLHAQCGRGDHPHAAYAARAGSPKVAPPSQFPPPGPPQTT